MSNKDLKFSVLILTLNEELNIQNCIASLSGCDDIVVLDSHSTDSTREIAEKSGARVFLRQFDNYAKQRNYGINEITYKHEWLLMLDADECMSPELFNEIKLTLRADNDITLYRIRRKDMFFGQWIKRSGGYPTWFGRLMKIGHVTVEREINEEYHTDGSVGYLKEHFYHYPFNNGIHAWFAKHNRYSTMEAEHKFNDGDANIPLTLLFDRDPANRRKAVKSIVYRMPMRPLIMFLSLYIFRLGFLDGSAGLKFSILRSIYEYMIDIKVAELERRSKNLQI